MNKRVASPFNVCPLHLNRKTLSHGGYLNWRMFYPQQKTGIQKAVHWRLMLMQQVKASTEYHSETVITPYSYTGARRLATVTIAFVILQSLSRQYLKVLSHHFFAQPSQLIAYNHCLSWCCESLSLCTARKEEEEKWGLSRVMTCYSYDRWCLPIHSVALY